jgi:4-amino-4-deoxy-L-arabinose transferase-like glycosyltransferase
LAEGRGFTLWNKPSIFVPPLYPAVLAGLRLLGGDSVWVIKGFQAVLGGAMVWLVYLLGRGILQQGVAYVASAVFAFHPEMIALSAFIYTEIVFIFLLLLFLLLVTQAVQTGKWSHFLFAGMLLGVTNLCRSTLLYFPIFLLLLSLFYHDGFRRRRIIGVVVLASAMMLTMLPWTIRNYLHVHAIVPVAIGGGDVFWAGNYLPFDGEFRYEETDKRIEELVGNNATLVERDRILMAEAKKNIMAQPVQAMQLFFRKIFRFWFRVYDNVPTGKARATNWVILAALGLTHFVLLALAVVGIWHMKMKKPFVAVMLALLLYYTLIHAATLAVPRYRQPLIPGL